MERSTKMKDSILEDVSIKLSVSLPLYDMGEETICK